MSDHTGNLITCSNLACLNTWRLERAHIITTRRTPEGCTELIQCPACGTQQTVTKPEVGSCEDGD